MKICHLLTTLLFLNISVTAQDLVAEKNQFTEQDTLRGSITPERVWWDLNYYNLDIQIQPEVHNR